MPLLKALSALQPEYTESEISHRATLKKLFVGAFMDEKYLVGRECVIFFLPNFISHAWAKKVWTTFTFA